MLFSKPVRLAAVASVMAADLFLTLWCQPEEYWDDCGSCVERNPIGVMVLCQGPDCWVALSCLYFFGVMMVLIKSRPRISSSVATLAFLGHAWGVSTWMHRFLP